MSGFRGAGLLPVNKSEPAKRIIGTNREVPLDSPRKAILKVVQAALSPEVDPDIAEAVQRRRQKRKRVQAEAGEVLTETAVERLRMEENQRQTLTKKQKPKGPKAKDPKPRVSKPKGPKLKDKGKKAMVTKKKQVESLTEEEVRQSGEEEGLPGEKALPGEGGMTGEEGLPREGLPEEKESLSGEKESLSEGEISQDQERFEQDIGK